MESAKTRVLFALPNKAVVDKLIARVEPKFSEMCEMGFVNSVEEYNAMEDKYSFDIVSTSFGGPLVTTVLKDQSLNSKRVKLVHALSAGVDAMCGVEEFVNAEHIPLTNAKGAFSHVLGEFIALGTLYFAKKVETFVAQKKAAEWKIHHPDLCSTKTMAIVGFGDIGAACGRIAKLGLQMRVIGLKRRPELTSEEHRSYADEVVGLDQLDRVIKEADYVVGVLPKHATTDDFFNMESCFSKMKPSAVFMNIGRGTTVNEDDLADVLNQGKIAGAVLDVFKVEPLPKESALWKCPNLLMTPHCADQDVDFMHRSFAIFIQNVENMRSGKDFVNIVEKKNGY